MTLLKARVLRLIAIVVAVLMAGLLSATAVRAEPNPVPSHSVGAAKQAGFVDPAKSLGDAWRGSSDVLIAGVGDASGFHIYSARESDAFSWKTLATLTSSTTDTAMWTGEVCVTGSGRYAVAVFGPAEFANRPRLLEHGGLAATIDISTGKAVLVARDVQLAYFNPACGPGDTVLLTRAIGADEGQTDLLTVDAVHSEVLSTRRINAQFTTPVPTSDGDYGIAHGALVKVGQAGTLTVVGHPAGRPFAIAATDRHHIDVASVNGVQAVVERYDGQVMVPIATGPWDKVQLFGLSEGQDALVGDDLTVSRAEPDLMVLSSPKQVRAVSRQGHLLATDIVTRQAFDKGASPLSRPAASGNGAVYVSARATKTGQDIRGTVTTTRAPTLNVALITVGGTGTPRVGAPSTVMNPMDESTPACAIGRDNPMIQALQPSPNMVEWAVDEAVRGGLTVSRPGNYLSSGQAPYTPQGMFPRSSLAGGGSVPAQVMLGILAQESNLDEASWHAVPGDTGNPLIADYYGNGDANDDLINYDAADCGYGIGQVTDGMRATDGTLSHAKQVAIATDYAANIAAALNILISKWNQVMSDSGGASFVNDGSPQYLENWFLAIWAYNSGFHPSSLASQNGGHWGVGWLNNPANPVYPANRENFLRSDYGDASHPADWSYEEKVLGWAETPQLKGDYEGYVPPIFGNNSPGHLSLPPQRQFCSSSINNCDPGATGDPCPAESDACWWHGTTDWTSCATMCGTEALTYSLGAGEPAIQGIYPRDCSQFTGGNDSARDTSKNSIVVYDLNDTTQYALGCGTQPSGGKFTLRLGYQPGFEPNAYYAQIDLHQIGAGYEGHMWFTHVWPPTYAGGSYNTKHQVTGTWTPELGLGSGQTGRYDILVHLPSHGGAYGTAQYVVFSGISDQADGTNCSINQDTSGVFSDGVDKWMYLGNHQLGRGARVELNNIGGGLDDGTVDIAFDGMAFVPTTGTSSNHCGDDY